MLGCKFFRNRAFRAFSCHYVNVTSDDVTVAMMGTQTKRNILIKLSFFPLYLEKQKKKHLKYKQNKTNKHEVISDRLYTFFNNFLIVLSTDWD